MSLIVEYVRWQGGSGLKMLVDYMRSSGSLSVTFHILVIAFVLFVFLSCMDAPETEPHLS